MGERHDVSLKEFVDREFAESSLLTNLKALEAYEVRARASLLGRAELPTSVQQRLSQFLVEDAHHLRATVTPTSGWGSQDLTHTLEASLRERDAILIELAHMLIVEPSIKALGELLSTAQMRTRDLLSKMASDEETHHRIYPELSNLAYGLDKAFAEYMGVNGLLLYVTVFPSDEGRAMLLSLLGRPTDEHSRLRTFYAQVDKLRMEAVSNFFGPDSLSLREVRGYGLARTGLC